MAFCLQVDMTVTNLNNARLVISLIELFVLQLVLF